jgi:hypothetical protein
MGTRGGLSNTACIELFSDPTIRSHFASLHDTLFERNPLRVVKPYSDSAVEIEYIAQQVGQGQQAVKTKYAYVDHSFASIWS